MRAVLQRVSQASVVVAGRTVGQVEHGICALVGVESGDGAEDARWLAGKVAGARLFTDDEGKMNRDVSDVGGAVLAISQFTLLGDMRKGRRPSFSAAMEPVAARDLFDAFCSELRSLGVPVQTGQFREHMEVSLVNQGPVTLLLDSRKTF